MPVASEWLISNEIVTLSGDLMVGIGDTEIMGKRALFLVLAGLAVAGCKPSKPELTLTAQQVLAQCKDAYSGLMSYEGKTVVNSTIKLKEVTSNQESSATVRFKKHKNLHVNGEMMGSSGTFEILSNEKGTWNRSTLTENKWQKSVSMEMAIATYTGVSGMAVTTIPSILARSNWDTSLTVGRNEKIEMKELNGKWVYWISGELGGSEIELWIDRETFLLLQRKMTMGAESFKDVESLLDNKVKSELSSVKDYQTTERFIDVQINHEIDDSVFADPMK